MQLYAKTKKYGENKTKEIFSFILRCEEKVEEMSVYTLLYILRGGEYDLSWES
jgi:hypothetical protein